MTDRLKGVTVVFEENIRTDDAEDMIKAIRMVKGVLAVEPLVNDTTQLIAEVRVRQELGQKLVDVLYPKKS